MNQLSLTVQTPGGRKTMSDALRESGPTFGKTPHGRELIRAGESYTQQYITVTMTTASRYGLRFSKHPDLTDTTDVESFNECFLAVLGRATIGHSDIAPNDVLLTAMQQFKINYSSMTLASIGQWLNRGCGLSSFYDHVNSAHPMFQSEGKLSISWYSVRPRIIKVLTTAGLVNVCDTDDVPKTELTQSNLQRLYEENPMIQIKDVAKFILGSVDRLHVKVEAWSRAIKSKSINLRNVRSDLNIEMSNFTDALKDSRLPHKCSTCAFYYVVCRNWDTLNLRLDTYHALSSGNEMYSAIQVFKYWYTMCRKTKDIKSSAVDSNGRPFDIKMCFIRNEIRNLMCTFRNYTSSTSENANRLQIGDQTVLAIGDNTKMYDSFVAHVYRNSENLSSAGMRDVCVRLMCDSNIRKTSTILLPLPTTSRIIIDRSLLLKIDENILVNGGLVPSMDVFIDLLSGTILNRTDSVTIAVNALNKLFAINGINRISARPSRGANIALIVYTEPVTQSTEFKDNDLVQGLINSLRLKETRKVLYGYIIEEIVRYGFDVTESVTLSFKIMYGSQVIITAPTCIKTSKAIQRQVVREDIEDDGVVDLDTASLDIPIKTQSVGHVGLMNASLLALIPRKPESSSNTNKNNPTILQSNATANAVDFPALGAIPKSTNPPERTFNESRRRKNGKNKY